MLLVAILSLAVCLRFYGLAWDDGFSYTPHPDERAILDRVIQISPPGISEIGLLADAEQSPWNPRWFNYGSFPLYVLKAVQILGASLLDTNTSDIRILGRAVSGLADIATILAVYGIASLAFDRRTGLLAALLTAFAVIHIQLSHFFAVDTVQTMFAVAALYFMVRVAREGRMRDSLLAGALVGLGLATKASQIPIIAPLFIAHLMFAVGLNGKTESGTFSARLNVAIAGLISAGALAVLTLLIAQPYTLIDWGTFLSHVSEQSEMIRGIRDYPYTRQYADTAPYWYHLRQLAIWGFGAPAGIVAYAGMLYISLRGMPLRFGLSYLAVGWVLPAAILLLSHSAIALVAAGGIALLALLATLPVRSKDTHLDVLLLCWVAPYFLVTGAFHVKFMRYMLPIAPLLTLFGARLLIALWDRSASSRKTLRPLVGVLIALVLTSTAFYALAYINGVYSERHTAVRASEWLNLNAPQNSLILKEHWEEALPNLNARFKMVDLPLYERDSSSKSALVASMLAEADYLVFFSNRLYGTISRLPERYPATTEYYRLLFSEELGYELVHFETSYPTLFGVSLPDDTLSRPNLPTPSLLSQKQSDASFTLDLGFADESYSVYDHPKVLIFENTERLESDQILRLLEYKSRASVEPQIGLVYSPQDARIQQDGGTWTDIIHPAGWTNRYPIIAWLVALELIALITLPLTFVIFRPLPDRGYLFAKILGILLVGLVVWLLASLQWLAFSRISIALAIGLITLVSLAVLAVKRGEIVDFIRQRWSTMLVAELIFLAAFLAFTLVRMANPDLWHPYRGGEKPMDFAYLNAVLRSTIMPPYDPWFGGGYLNYYYWGQFITSALIKLTAIEPTTAFNLAIPTFFSLTFGGAYTIVGNLVESTRGKLRPSSNTIAAPPVNSEEQAPSSKSRWSIFADSTFAGIIGALFVTVLGNLDGALQVWHGVNNLLRGNAFGEFDFWRSSRMMPPDPPGHEITEFPFFTFLFADLHAHLIAIPFTLLVIGLSLAIVLAVRPMRAATNAITPERLQSSMPLFLTRLSAWALSATTLRLVALGIAVGSLAALNTWDLPTYLIVGSAAILFAEFLKHGGLGLMTLLRASGKIAFMGIVGFIAFLPYHMANESFYNSIQSTTNTTTIWQFLAISGLFVLIIGTFAIDEIANGARKQGAALLRNFKRIQDILDGYERKPFSIFPLVALILGALLLGLALAAAFSGVLGSTVPFIVALMLLLGVVGVRLLLHDKPDTPQLGFALILIFVSLSLVVGLDFLRVEGDIDRLNSIFKFYLQVWVMLAIASAYLLWRLFQTQRSFLARMASVREGWLIALALVVLSASIYPIMGTRDRIRDRFNGYVTPLTLDGVAFIEGSEYRERSGEVINLAADYEGIRWLQMEAQGSPIVLEAVTPSYRWGGRISMYTGLPSVVGWQWHQEQQRRNYSHEVSRRRNDVETIYATQNAGEALRLLRQYDVKYVYLGQLERLYFPSGMDKFEDGIGGALQKVFDNGETIIYRLN